MFRDVLHGDLADAESINAFGLGINHRIGTLNREVGDVQVCLSRRCARVRFPATKSECFEPVNSRVFTSSQKNT